MFKMRNINVSEIESLISELCIKANKKLPEALECKIRECGKIEKSAVGRAVFDDLCANIVRIFRFVRIREWLLFL